MMGWRFCCRTRRGPDSHADDCKTLAIRRQSDAPAIEAIEVYTDASWDFLTRKAAIAAVAFVGGERRIATRIVIAKSVHDAELQAIQLAVRLWPKARIFNDSRTAVQRSRGKAQWISRTKNPAHDYAIIRVIRRDGESIPD